MSKTDSILRLHSTTSRSMQSSVSYEEEPINTNLFMISMDRAEQGQYYVSIGRDTCVDDQQQYCGGGFLFYDWFDWFVIW